ncbi:InlB B-repeat-containing protein [Ruminococcus sp.]|uniref:InlB B-repeat-containing protein n=1 Tax=Ruminococcus sp. TaxID=41978 RepID=UPI003AF453C1
MKKRSLQGRITAFILTLCLAAPQMSMLTFAENSTVSNETELKSALENTEFAEIKLGGNIETTWELDVERTVTLDLNGYTLSCSSTDEDIIRVRSSGNLTVKDSGTNGKIDGQNKNCGFEVKGGTLTLESGSIVNCTDADGDGGAVDVSNTGVTETPVKYGKFVMNGGTIKDCKAGDDGAAVDIGMGCTFTMNDGTISNCRAEDDGGAVFVKHGGFFVMNSGTIENCSACNNGGAVNIYENGSFTMTGGTIKDCKVDLGGLGNAVYGKNNTAIVVISGGTIENCGVFPWSFDEFTVTFDSDGGSAVSEQKVLNTSAIEPNEPKRNGYDFAGWYLNDAKYTFDTKITGNITLKAHWTPSATSSNINMIDIENVKLDYQPDTAPQASAKRTGANQDKYDILFECWKKREKDADDTMHTVGYWYSDESDYSDGDVRFNTFEKGGRYRYSVKLKAKDGYTFDSNLKDENVTLNGASLPFGSWVDVMNDGKTCLITYGTETRPGQTVEEIRLDAIINFNAGDKPHFYNSSVDPFVDLDHERWDANDSSGYGITSSDYWNERYNGKLITEFEAGKSYTYGVYFKISDLGMEEGYRFDQNTKLYINDEEITLTPDQIDIDDNGETIWFSNVLTMMPEDTGEWKMIDTVEINDAAIDFKNGDKPVFTGKTPENAPYIYQFECWETKDGAGVNSAEFFDNAYEKHITEFESGETYQYILYFKAKESYYFTPDTKIKINGTLYNYRLVNIDPGSDELGGKMFTFWAYTDLTMTPKANDTSSDSSDTNSDSKDTSSNNSGTSTNSNSNTDSKTPAKNNAGSTNPNTGNNVGGILLTIIISGSGLVIAGRRSRKNK